MSKTLLEDTIQTVVDTAMQPGDDDPMISPDGYAMETPGFDQQWKIMLHSNTGPVHFIAIFEDGSAYFK